MNSRIVFILLCSTLSSYGQDFVVTTKQDTLRGRITIMSYPGMDRVQVVGATKKKQEFYATTILLVQIDSQTYKTVTTTDGYRFMLLSRSGFLSLYYARQSPGTPYTTPYLVKRTGESLEVPTLLFKKQMADFLRDCVMIKEKIEKDGLGKKDLDLIINEYNHCLDRQTGQAFVAVSDPKLLAITEFKNKLEQDKTVPVDAFEILKDLYQKAKENKPIPNYLKDGLREVLKDHQAHQADLVNLLNKLNP